MFSLPLLGHPRVFFAKASTSGNGKKMLGPVAMNRQGIDAHAEWVETIATLSAGWRKRRRSESCVVIFGRVGHDRRYCDSAKSGELVKRRTRTGSTSGINYESLLTLTPFPAAIR